MARKKSAQELLVDLSLTPSEPKKGKSKGGPRRGLTAKMGELDIRGAMSIIGKFATIRSGVQAAACGTLPTPTFAKPGGKRRKKSGGAPKQPPGTPGAKKSRKKSAKKRG